MDTILFLNLTVSPVCIYNIWSIFRAHSPNEVYKTDKILGWAVLSYILIITSIMIFNNVLAITLGLTITIIITSALFFSDYKSTIIKILKIIALHYVVIIIVSLLLGISPLFELTNQQLVGFLVLLCACIFTYTKSIGSVKRYSASTEEKSYLKLIQYTIPYLIIITVLILDKEGALSSGLYSIVLIVFLFSTIISFELYDRLDKQYSKFVEYQSLKNEKIEYANHLKMYQIQNDEKRKILHDLNNRLLLLNEFLERNPNDELRTILENVIPKGSIEKELYSGNVLIDSILSQKIE